ncbi:riboflavin biosynthesis protein RibF [Enemella dayhoffiae]|uniref:Riboflavin biosynthesis protein n=1 Tax=Enemella dayhoffiae TaxID=2016507 RepID=A0A255GUY0_9ACTN|nr:bifunctional riboflavin kinase/FAD synthetase [Enemella dayhoffiae]OYO19440.1 riboflavin biosynthesis protein RibF [Enemella dayhoffiae]
MDQPSVVVIGNFDGVHKGHQEVLRAARTPEPGARLVAVTFWPHPMSVVRPGQEPLLLCDLSHRISLLREAGADQVEVIRFTPELMATSPEDFVREKLLPLHPVRVVVGQNFRFGHRAAGTVDTLTELGAQGLDGTRPFAVSVLELLVTEHHTTSSTEIRRLLAEGDVATAAQHLGRLFSFTGEVVVGHQRGREFGFPTANLPVPKGFAAPADGVYAGWLRRCDLPNAPLWPAAISVGTNPTFDDVPEVVVEAHVLDRDDLELYGVQVSVDFVQRLRGNVKFEGIPQLIEQIGADVEETRRVLGLG